MKLLFDHNLSPRLVGRLRDLYPDSLHLREIQLHTSDDPIVWDYALAHGFTIVSKDSDFRQRSFVFGHPPKVVWVHLSPSPPVVRDRPFSARAVPWYASAARRS
ncbi:DUF5615 family PIN-like protein [Aquisalimonas sp.]|uniref:DUF5615 family PIN-like protein n=1 Tax=Aquisalimonas sp. TaxID=1872621 RepID=UPI003453E77A